MTFDLFKNRDRACLTIGGSDSSGGAGIQADIKRELWNKLIINVGINAITAITGLENGYIYKMKNLRELSRRCV